MPLAVTGGGNCFLLNSRAHYLVLYLSQGGKSFIFILPLNLCLCNLSGTGVSCLILFSIIEREYIIQSLHLYFHLLGDLLWSLITTSKRQSVNQRSTPGPFLQTAPAMSIIILIFEEGNEVRIRLHSPNQLGRYCISSLLHFFSEAPHPITHHLSSISHLSPAGKSKGRHAN